MAISTNKNPLVSGKTNGKQNLRTKTQVIESLRDLAGGTFDSLAKDVAKQTAEDFFRQIIGMPEKKVTGELVPGETLEMNSALSGEAEKNRQLEAQIHQERNLRQEEQALSMKKQQELRLQISALSQEVNQLAKTTQGLSREMQIAAVQAPVDPGTYHVAFFEKLIGFIRTFRKRIDNASVWLGAYNARSKKRANSFWGQVGISGAKRMLSPEDYLQRSAA